MKKRISFVKRLMLISSVVFMSAFVFSSCEKDDDNNNNNTTTMYNISGNANGTQVVPSVSGSGTASITGTYNTNTKVLTYTTNWTTLTGAPTMGAFYTGASGTNGTIVGSNWTLGSGLTATGTFSSTATLTDAQQASLLAGNLYYVLGTSTNASGEVRGQITATPQ